MTFIPRDLLRRLESAEAQQRQAGAGSIRERILAARAAPPTPVYTRAELQATAVGTGLVARIARGMIRIGHVAPAPTGAAPLDPDTVLPQMAGYLFARPLDFVLFAFDFGVDRSLRLVKLPELWTLFYESEFGVEQWACELLEQIGEQVRERAFDGTHAVDAIRHAVASGHGISKSATTAMIVSWLMSTRPNARGVVTATTAPQLASKTWAEIAKWTRRSVFAEWFSITTGVASMKLSHREAPEAWNVIGATAAEERAEAFAGLHAADSSPFYIFDEASGIPAAIWEVAEGGMTDGEPFWFAFGNPTRNTGRFFDSFHGQRHRWTTRQVDSRSCQLTNKRQIEEWLADFGAQSDFVKVRVLGQFPSASSMQFISRELVDAAIARETPSSRYETLVLGVDPARFGDDSSVIYTRAGRDARTWPPIRLRGVDTMTLASRVAEHYNFLRRAGHRVLINVDGGGVGGGVCDRLRQLGYRVNEVQFGAKALDPRKYANRRAEIWGALREWLAGGSLVDDKDLVADLTAVEYGYTALDAILLERKADMKARGLASPDTADALAITFAVPTPPALPDEDEERQMETERQAVLNHDPLRAVRA